MREQKGTYIIQILSFMGKDISYPFNLYFYSLGIVLSVWHILTHLIFISMQ